MLWNLIRALRAPEGEGEGASGASEGMGNPFGADSFAKAEAFLEAQEQGQPPGETPPAEGQPPATAPAETQPAPAQPAEQAPVQEQGDKPVLYSYVYKGQRFDIREQADLDLLLEQGFSRIEEEHQRRSQPQQPAQAAPEETPAADKGKEDNPLLKLLKGIRKDLDEQKKERETRARQEQVESVQKYLSQAVAEAMPKQKVFTDLPEVAEEAKKMAYSMLAYDSRLHPEQAVAAVAKLFQGLTNKIIKAYAAGKFRDKYEAVGTPGGRGVAVVPKKQTWDDIKSGRTLEAAEEFLRSQQG